MVAMFWWGAPAPGPVKVSRFQKKLSDVQDQAQACGSSLVYVAQPKRVAGAIQLKAALRPETQAFVQALKQRGLRIYIFSGDQESPTKQLAE